jgi:hypothetical protein
MATEQQEFVDFEIEADFENIKEFGGRGFPLLPVNDYIFEVEHVEQKPSSKNTPMVVVTSKVAEGQEDDEAAKYTGQKVWANYPLTDKAMGRLKNIMIACGAPLDKFRASALMGAKYRASIVHNQGDATPGPDGQPREARMFANLCNERPLETIEAAAPPPPPPATKKATATTTKPAAAPATRRA